MKFLCTLLAMLVLILSVQPVCASASNGESCCTAEEYCNEQQQQGHSDDERDCKSGCNPFQVCACCAFCIVVPAELTFVPQLPAHQSLVQWGVLSAHLTDEPVSAFWQPPRA